MEAAVVGAVVGTNLRVVIDYLILISTEEIKLIRDFKKDLEKLKTTLITIQEFVTDAETQQVTNLSIKRWLKKLEDAAFEAYYVLDELHYISLRTARHKGAFKKMIKSMAAYFHDRSKFGHKMSDINEKLESINSEASGLGLQTRLLVGLHATGDASAGEETDSFTFDPVFLGRDDDVKEIVKKLNIISTDQFQIIPIVGMGGMGKSTLAREVIKVQTLFKKPIWVHVSANFDPIMLFKKILMVLTSEDVKVENREVVLKKLEEALANKAYLLVLDDVWNEEGLKWEGFINSLSGITSTKGNAIIVTTRKANVASIVATLPIHELKGLPEDSCWSIIKAKAFRGDIAPLEFETLGRSIAKRCRGLPLAANVAGGVLRGKSKEEWLSIQDNWLSDHVEGDFITKVLKLSFDNLSSPSLKKCFAYCSIFPKGVSINRVDLVQFWMAEGFLEADQRSDMETKGNKFFNLLLHNSLLLNAGRDEYNNVRRCSMHDLVHDVAVKVNGNISDGIYRARFTGHEFYGDESKENAKYVRTLFFKGGISDSMFSDFKSLHVLTLMSKDVKELPSSIRELIHLRYLNISETEIKDLPDTIGELYHLQTFRAETSTLRKLPNTLKYLIGLRHLHVLEDTKFPSELGKLTSLQTIPCFPVGDEKGHQIVELGSLNSLKGEMKIYNLEKVKDKGEAKSACLFHKPGIVKLVLQWGGESSEGEINYENVLEGLQPHPNLKILEILGFNGSQFPPWALKMAVQDDRLWEGLNNLMEIRIERCFECEQVPMMGHLPHLKSLYLVELRNVKSIGSSFYGIEHCNGIVFPALKHLVIQNMPKIREWVEVKVKVFPFLEYLKISYCKELKSAPSHFPCLKELELSMMDSGLPLANICGINLKSLTKLRIMGIQELESLPHGLFYNNQHLSELEIQGCPRLRELADGLHTLNSLQDLNIERCPSLMSIPDCSTASSFTSFRRLVITDCPKLMNLPAEMVESCGQSLECLQLRGIRSVMNMQMLIDRLHKTNMPRLTNMALTSIPKFITASPTETLTLCSLRELSIHVDSDSWDCVSFKDAVDGILMRFGSNSLGTLKLTGMEDWKSLPDQLQHLSGVRRLDLNGFGIEELPEWFGNLSSLQTLFLWNFKKLRSLPSMQRLTNLTRLYIRDCPVLKEGGIEQRRDDHDSQWPNIPYIWVDGHPLK